MDFDDTSCPRTLRLILGDQLDAASPVLEGLSPGHDVLWMAEVREESTHVWSHRARTTLFLSAMRHFRDELRAEGHEVQYHSLDRAGGPFGSLGEALGATLNEWRPDSVRVVRPGDHRVLRELQDRCRDAGVPLEILPDPHFLTSVADFAEYAEGRKQLRLEYFYRPLRRRFDILMRDDEPEGGQWNYDADNRGSFGRKGPPPVPAPRRFEPDDVTREVIAVVERHFPDHPGSLQHFDWPVSRAEALQALDDFVEWRLPYFGKFQDAMWTNEPFLFHSRLSAALNLKLLHPREVIDRAEDAYRAGQASLEATEGFVRQILGWREYVRGIYWHFMPDYGERNFLRADAALPKFYWTADTEMHCLRQSLHQTLEYGYAHHIQRLMVTGLFSLLLGVNPRAIHEWYLAVYVDAIEWVELPNTIGMSQFADGGVMASKPYAATGKYIQRMSNYCGSCRFNPAKRTGDDACPFTTLYWDFLSRHRERLAANQRMSLQLRNVDRLTDADRSDVRREADVLRSSLA